MLVPKRNTYAERIRRRRLENAFCPFPPIGKRAAHGCINICRDHRREIIEAYLRKLECLSAPIAAESDLPHRKSLIDMAILQELCENPSTDSRNHLEIAYVQLASFISQEEYRVLADFKDASLRAQEIADCGDPTSIIRSAGIMRHARGDRAVAIQEKISKDVAERLKRLQKMEAVDMVNSPCI